MSRKKPDKNSTDNMLPLAVTQPPMPLPDFTALLRDPLVDQPLPRAFSVEQESAHLTSLWQTSPKLQRFLFDRFIHAGGSGMVFRVTTPESPNPLALKVVRHKLYTHDKSRPEIATSLSPVSERELRALSSLSHQHIVHLFDAIEDARGVFAIVTTYVENPQPLDVYLKTTLEKHPDPHGKKGIHPFSPQRLDSACAFLVERCIDIASALEHMHSLGFYHCDVKPANLLIDTKSLRAVLTDLGSCIRKEDADAGGDIRMQFTWTYAHPELTDLINDPTGISGGGLKASATVRATSSLARFDLFAFGRTIQEALAAFVNEFGERCYASYGFRFLHLVACLLLDGRNAVIRERSRLQDGKRFVDDLALGYPVHLFAEQRISTARALLLRLRRFSRDYTVNEAVPELNPWYSDAVNTGPGGTAPFTKRVSAVFNHPCVRRLRSELQLGWVREVYPGATHSRWSHTLGAFAATTSYYNSLLADPEVPTVRVLLEPGDIAHGLMAAILHDLGQMGFAHDFESSCPELYNHEQVVTRLLSDDFWGKPTLKDVLARHWPDIDVDRVLSILRHRNPETQPSAQGSAPALRQVDGLACDIVDGPIDVDKYDYLYRDSMSCGVPYGAGIDRNRFLRALTVDARDFGNRTRLALAYRAKGAAAIESLLLARYQLYGAVYWHHTFRCIQAMFTHATASTFGHTSTTDASARGKSLPMDAVSEMLYRYVVCGRPWADCISVIQVKRIADELAGIPPPELAGERALEFVWRFADNRNRKLMERLAKRDLFKRVFEIRIGDLDDEDAYQEISKALTPEQRVAAANELEQHLLNAVHKKMSEKGPTESIGENEAQKRFKELQQKTVPRVIVDFPTRGIPNEKNFPKEIGDPARKYIDGKPSVGTKQRNIFHVVRRLQTQIATIRVFAAPEFHELVTRYLDPQDVRDCVDTAIPRLRTQQ